MSYKQCIFAVPTEEVSRDRLLQAIRTQVADLASQLGLPDIFALVSDEAKAEEAGLRYFMLGTAGSRGRMIDRGFLVESWVYSDELPLVVALHDDQHGIYQFKTWPAGGGPATFLMSDGCYLGGDLAAIELDYPQKGFGNDQLKALHQKPEANLTDEEYRAIAEYSNALQLGLRQFYPEAAGVGYLDLLYHDTAHCVHRADGSAPPTDPIARPSDWSNAIAFWPEDSEWRRAGLEQRYY